MDQKEGGKSGWLEKKKTRMVREGKGGGHAGWLAQSVQLFFTCGDSRQVK